MLKAEKDIKYGSVKKKSPKSHHSRHQWRKGIHCMAVSVTISQPEKQSSLRTTESLNSYSIAKCILSGQVVSAQLGGGGVFQNHVSVEKLMKTTSTCVELTFKPFPTPNALFKYSFKQFKGKRSGETLTTRSVHRPTPVCRCSSKTDRVGLPTQQTFSCLPGVSLCGEP